MTPDKKIQKALFWHRRDLRIEDNAGLYKALKQSEEVIPVFIFDSTILELLPGDDQRVLFIYRQIEQLRTDYHVHHSDLYVAYGDPKKLIPELARLFQAEAVFTNRDYEPAAVLRDQQVHEALAKDDIPLIGAKDHVIFEKSEVVKDDGEPYVVYTPYMKKWREKLNDFYLSSYPVKEYTPKLSKQKHSATPSLTDMGFSDKKSVDFPPAEFPSKTIRDYDKTRDFPADTGGTSRLGMHLRFGTISIRELARYAQKRNETYLNELIWREFYQMILYHFPHSAERSFRQKYDDIPWSNNEAHFEKWCAGKTGYPLVDAGMRQLNESGYMHNRVRMVVASFLTKHLLIDWRWGEAYFAHKLLDYEQASNVGLSLIHI